MNESMKDTNPKDMIGSNKVRLSTVPANVMFDVALALTEGMVKYGRHNYRAAGVRSSVYYDAAMGHLMDWFEGEDVDADSGLSHVTKAIASLVVLRDAMHQGMLTDDRPPSSKLKKRDFNGKSKEIIDRYAEMNPRHYTIADTKKAEPKKVSEKTLDKWVEVMEEVERMAEKTLPYPRTPKPQQQPDFINRTRKVDEIVWGKAETIYSQSGIGIGVRVVK